MHSYTSLYRSLSEKLAPIGATEAKAESWVILSHLTGLSRTQLLRDWTTPQPLASLYSQLYPLIAKRLRGMPLAYLLGDWSFCGHPLKVHRGVLIPRPETELLVNVAKTCLRPDTCIFELGVGTGAIPLALAHSSPICYHGWDSSRRAIANAKENLYHVPQPFKKAQITLHAENFFAKTAYWRTCLANTRHLLFISNPPYLSDADMRSLQPEVQYEPKRALSGGKDGLSFYKRLFHQCLTPDKAPRTMVLEIGIDQQKPLSALLSHYPCYAAVFHDDLSGIPRVMAITPKQ